MESDSSAVGSPASGAAGAQNRKFLIELALLALLAAGLWFAFGPGLSDVDRLVPEYRWDVYLRSWERFFVFLVVAITFLTVVYYATSFEVTPFRLLMPWIMRFPRGASVHGNENARSISVSESASDYGAMAGYVPDEAIEVSGSQPKPKYTTVNAVLNAS